MFSLRNLAIALAPCIFLVLLCIGSYYNALRNEFAFDDYLAIVNNKDVMYGSNSSNRITEYTILWRNDIWGKNMGAFDSHRSYRPLLITVFKLLVDLNGLDPKTFRIASIICHTIATLCVFRLSSIIFGKRNGFLSLGSALLFACHPVHVEAVTAVVNMAEAISLVFYITAYSLYFKSSRENIGTHSSYSSSISQFLKKFLLVGWWLIFLIVSVLFKETSVTLCGVMIASSGITLLTTVKLSYLANRKAFFMKGSTKGLKLVGKRERQQKEKTTIVSILYFSIEQWLHREFLWVLAPLFGLLLYCIFRVILLNPKLSPFLMPNFKEFWRSLGKSYLQDSKLIRKAENPFAFLIGKEKTLSLMV